MTDARISYGKLAVPVHCVGVRPLRGLPAVPESPLRALDSGVLAAEVSIEVLGQGFLPAYTEGDNREVVATDTMKNVILRHALEHDGAVPEGFLHALGHRFLSSYPEMEGLRLFARDEATTLPERSDRPLFIHMGVHWRYADPADALAGDPSRYVAAAQVRDVLATVFHEFVSESIQHLVHEMGQRLLDRYPALAEVSFAAENHTHDPVPGSEPGAARRAYTSAFPAYGLITLTLAR